MVNQPFILVVKPNLMYNSSNVSYSLMILSYIQDQTINLFGRKMRFLMKDSIFEVLNGQTIYRVPKQNKSLSGTVSVPGSKSITNRALLMAALADGVTTLKGVLFSDDSRHFLSSLISLGFDVQIDEPNQRVRVQGLGGSIPLKEATINVGSAGTASRFLTAMLALSKGEYIIQCSEQMKKRPMKPLFDALVTMGASFKYLEEAYHLPVKVTGNKGKCQDVSLDITKSTQFLSALLMVGPLTDQGFNVHISSKKTDGAYIQITRHMVEQFGGRTSFQGKSYKIFPNTYKAMDYPIEPDMSAACYFYSIAALTGGSVLVKGVKKDLMQGDLRYLDLLQQMTCTIKETELGIEVTGPKDGRYPGIDIDMNNFSDQAMTLAALAPFATTETIIRGVSHIKIQECDRMTGIVTQLNKVGIKSHADGENIYIQPGHVNPAIIETYDDHRFAMAFTLLGLRADGIIINDPMCCRKTFEDYFEVLENFLASNH